MRSSFLQDVVLDVAYQQNIFGATHVALNATYGHLQGTRVSRVKQPGNSRHRKLGVRRRI